MNSKQDAAYLIDMINRIDEKIDLLKKKRAEIKYKLYKQYPHHVDADTMMRLERF